jgi:uncharacterized protein
MLIVISPAKTLDFKSEVPTSSSSEFEFTAEAQDLIALLQKKSVEDIKKLMSLSDKLAQLNKDRFDQWKLPMDQSASRASVFAFKGEVYQGLSPYDMSEENLAFAQDHLRVLSGLYGLLKPLDRMLPYRLEMGTKLVNEQGKDLYQFWGSKITDLLKIHMPKNEDRFLVNLASNEYFKSVKAKDLGFDVITPQFLDEKNGKFKIISFYAKKARGLMSAWIIKNKITTVNELSKFDCDGYYYDSEQSTEVKPIFMRNEK